LSKMKAPSTAAGAFGPWAHRGKGRFTTRGPTEMREVLRCSSSSPSQLALFLRQTRQEIGKGDPAGQCRGVLAFEPVFPKPCRKRFAVAVNLPIPRPRVMGARSRSSYERRVSVSFGHGFRAPRKRSCMLDASSLTLSDPSIRARNSRWTRAAGSCFGRPKRVRSDR
jgi:hypothetical protein